ncbi:MAG: UTP--glucose-1-phosphate uridylyltransferase [Verrucomicrobia bacterium]|nr:UTP--glucose-1-phosphate uridylyltransferase [Verrucomicrobiota bacterium]
MSCNIDREIVVEQNLAQLAADLKNSGSNKKKVEILGEYISKRGIKYPEKPDFSEQEKVVLYSILALGQEHVLTGVDQEELDVLNSLFPVEQFYQEIGGLVGYHLTCLWLLAKKGNEIKGSYYPPEPIDISCECPLTRKSVISALEHLDEMAEIYPLGGAADRLSLSKDDPGIFQIAATLEFCEKALLERLIEDLQAREFLYYKIFQKQVRVPIVLMTSEEKGGTTQVNKSFKEKNWYGKRREDIFLFSQPLVPTMDKEGRWSMIGKGKLLLKPGGHGVVWKLAKESGAFDWLEKRGKTKALVRQINNLVASVDYGLLAFLGIGFDEKKDLGFAACPCAKGVSEGVNVVVETDQGLCLTNIEYCEGVESVPSTLANTNLLFVSIETIKQLLQTCPIPGMLVNAKKMKYRDASGLIQEKEVVRLESTMQNIADALVEPSEITRSYITVNKRKKTISTIKKEFAFGSSMLQTPEQCYLDMMENGRDLLVNYCHFQVPNLNDSMSFFQDGPSFIFLYHPALGPLYEIIQQKLKKGRLAVGSELKLKIAELYVENLDVDGSLEIVTDSIMGHQDEEGVIQYSDQTGKCILKNVRVRNSGINREASRSFWKDEIVHREKCEIFIEQGGEFYAENVNFRGEIFIRVPSGVKMTAYMQDGRVEFIQEVLDCPSWCWKYQINEQDGIELRR